MRLIAALCIALLVIGSSISRDGGADQSIGSVNPHIALIGLAHLVRANPYVLQQIECAKDCSVWEQFDRFVQGFTGPEPMTLVGLLAKTDSYCILQPQRPGQFCSFRGARNADTILYLTEPDAKDQTFLMIVSDNSPENTRIYRWDAHSESTLLYSSYSATESKCSSAFSEYARYITSIEVVGPNSLMLFEQGNIENEYKRTLKLITGPDKCRLEMDGETNPTLPFD